MIYAISDMKKKRKWTVLRGWLGCQAGQGSVLATNVSEKNVKRIITKYEKDD